MTFMTCPMTFMTCPMTFMTCSITSMTFSMTALLLLGLQVQGLLASFQLPPFIQALTKDKADGQGDRLSTFPPNVLNVDDIRRFTPRKRHLKTKKLFKKMNKDFDSFWMSVEVPDDLHDTHIRQKVDVNLEEQLHSFNLTALASKLQQRFHNKNMSGVESDVPSGTGQIGLTSSLLDLVKAWLVESASCPVYYRWEDLGLLYWPRWVRRGMCSLRDAPLVRVQAQSTSKLPSFSSCSWPPGMHCVPGKAARLKILRWQCRHNKALDNFNRFQLPGMPAPLSGTSMTLNPGNSMSRTTYSNQDWARLLLHQGSNITSTSKLDIHQLQRKQANAPQGRSRRDKSGHLRSHRGTDLQNYSSTLSKQLSKRNNSTLNIRDRLVNTPDAVLQSQVKMKQSSESSRKKTDPEANGTEKWNRKVWKQRQKALDLKCKWVKIPYPVTDNCFCSC